ncbi:MAG: 6-bladed beta-propeller [Gemmatimonadaceae bacterium]|nr:6-bladed beta-propeller [Gemmatimonadaceae bacterium]
MSAISACAGTREASTSAQTRDSAGVAIADGPLTDVPLPWTLTELRRIGGADSGAGAFNRVAPSSVATDGRTRIAVLDTDNENRVHVFDSSGAVIRTMGGRGAGPGETTYPDGLRFEDDGSLAVFDYAKMALVRFDSGGAPQRERSVASGRGQLSGAPRVTGDVMWVLLDRMDSVSQIRRLERWSPQDTLVIDSTVEVKPKMHRFTCIGLALSPLFSPEIEWSTIGARDVAVTTQSTYVVNIYRDGRLIRSVRRPVVPTATRPEDAARLYPDGLKVGFDGGECVTPSAEIAEKVGMAPTLPVVRSSLMAPDGSLWVARYTLKGETPSVDVFSPAGQYEGTLRGRGLPLGFLGNDIVLFAITNADDDTSVVGLFRIARPR